MYGRFVSFDQSPNSVRSVQRRWSTVYGGQQSVYGGVALSVYGVGISRCTDCVCSVVYGVGSLLMLLGVVGRSPVGSSPPCAARASASQHTVR